MKTSLVAVICILLSMICMQSSSGFQSVGDGFGTSWLAKYGTQPISKIENQNNLWDWGYAPKGFSLLNGTLYPPGYAPQWFYPDTFRNNDTPIIMNNTGSSNLQNPNNPGVDPWLTAQLTGRPVKLVKEPLSSLF